MGPFKNSLLQINLELILLRIHLFQKLIDYKGVFNIICNDALRSNLQSLNIANLSPKMNRSQMTSISFTVDDDLISQSSLNSTIRSKQPNKMNPFSKQYGIAPISNQKLTKKLQEQAQNGAYKQLNDELFNPFEHKLGTNFMPGEDRFYENEKRRQLQLIKKREEEAMNKNKNYTIIFNNNPPSEKKDVLQKAGKNLVNGQENSVPTISDYYNKKFMKKKMEVPIVEQENDDDKQKPNNQKDKQVNNFVSSTKKNEKKPTFKSSKDVQPKALNQSMKRNSQNLLDSRKKQKQEESIRHQLKNETSDEDSLDNIERLTSNNRTHKKPQQYKEIPSKKPTTGQKMQKPKPALNPDEVKRELKKQLPQRKPQVPKPNKPNPKNKNQQANKLGDKKKYADVYEGPDRNLVEQLERQLAECPSITFDDIAELDTAKNLLQEAVLLPRLMPQFFQGIRRATKGILLFGPPGTGKTLLAKAVAKDNVFLNVSASSLASKWKGQSQKMVRLLFEIAKYYAPSVIFFDEIDAIGSKRSSNQHESNRKVKTQLLVQMDGVGSENNDIVVLAASNRPWDLDEALRRRLQKRIYIPLPGKQGRKKMFEINLRGVKISQKIDWNKLAQLTKGHSGADICNVCRDAAYMPMRRKIQEIGGIQKLAALKQDEIIEEQLKQSDLIQASKRVKPSVGKEDLKKYQAWMAQFGSS